MCPVQMMGAMAQARPCGTREARGTGLGEGACPFEAYEAWPNEEPAEALLYALLCTIRKAQHSNAAGAHHLP